MAGTELVRRNVVGDEFLRELPLYRGLPRWLSGKESTCQAGGVGSIPGSGRYPREGKGNLIQYSCPGSPWTEEPSRLKFMGPQKSQP